MNGAHAPDDAQLEEAARRLAAGRLVAFPTETVYGLGADASDPAAVARIYGAKGRPSNHPVIVHLAPGARVEYWAARVPAQARALMDAFWPGPLTLILPRAPHIPDAVSGGQDSIGLRCPSHPVAQALLARFAGLKGGHGGVAAPSANKFGQVSPTCAEHVRAEFPELDDDALMVLEGGPSQVGIESTIVDLSRLEQGVGPAILRPGHITAAQIGRVLRIAPDGLLPGHEPGDGATCAGCAVSGESERHAGREVDERGGARRMDDVAQGKPRAPRVSGSLKAHYAPRTPLQVLPRGGIRLLLQSAAGNDERMACVVFGPPESAFASSPGVDWFAAQPDPDAYARELYALLRRLDQGGYARLVFEQPPRSAPWQAVNDRLGRAAAAFGG